MAKYYERQIERAKDTETVNHIIEELAFADITKAEYFELFDRAEERIAELMTA